MKAEALIQHSPFWLILRLFGQEAVCRLLAQRETKRSLGTPFDAECSETKFLCLQMHSLSSKLGTVGFEVSFLCPSSPLLRMPPCCPAMCHFYYCSFIKTAMLFVWWSSKHSFFLCQYHGVHSDFGGCSLQCGPAGGAAAPRSAAMHWAPPLLSHVSGQCPVLPL